MNRHYHIDQLEKYLSGKMQDEERNRLEKAALDDPFLQDAIDGYESNSGSIEDNLPIKSAIMKSRNKILYLAAASLTLLIVVSVVFVNNNGSKSVLLADDVEKQEESLERTDVPEEKSSQIMEQEQKVERQTIEIVEDEGSSISFGAQEGEFDITMEEGVVIANYPGEEQVEFQYTPIDIDEILRAQEEKRQAELAAARARARALQEKNKKPENLSFQAFVKQNIRNPNLERSNANNSLVVANRAAGSAATESITQVSGSVVLMVSTRANGKIKSVYLEQSLGEGYDEEAFRLVGIYKNWPPDTEQRVEIEF